MIKEQTDEELWADLREIQASMAIEGFELSEDQMQKVFHNVKNDPDRNIYRELKERADRTGEDYGKLVDQYLDSRARKRAEVR